MIPIPQVWACGIFLDLIPETFILTPALLLLQGNQFDIAT